MGKEITSYKDLLRAQQELKLEIYELESEIGKNKILKLASFFFSEESVKEPLFESLSSMNFKNLISGSLANLLSTFLMSNKVTRKYFISFTVFKELAPYLLEKIKSMIDQNDLDAKRTTN